MPADHASILLDLAVDALTVGGWGGLLAGGVCLWSAHCGRRLLVSIACGMAVVAVCSLALLTAGEPARVVEFGTWLAVGGACVTNVALEYRVDVVASAVFAAVSLALIVLITRTTDDADASTARTLWWAFVFTAAAQFALSTGDVLRFGFWQLLGIAGLVGPSVTAIAEDRRASFPQREFAMRLAGDGCILLAIAADATSAPMFGTTTMGLLLSAGVLARFITSPAWNSDGVPDRWLIAPLGFLWLDVSTQTGELLSLATILIAAIVITGRAILRDRPEKTTPAIALRLARTLGAALNAFENHVVRGAMDAVANLPRRIWAAGEPLRGQTSRFYTFALALATFTLLLCVVGWRVVS